LGLAFLSKWINDELSEKELLDFELTPEYKEYKKILAHADALDIRGYDTDYHLAAIKSKAAGHHRKRKSKVIQFIPYLAVAASIAIIVGIFLFKSDTTTYTTDYGKQLAIQLPDGSEMILNSKSKASYSSKDWFDNRIVTLEGEAYFKVKKGSKFKVQTENGIVSVLGTQFTVQSQEDFFEVSCYEGKVNVADNNQSTILTKGKGIRIIDHKKSSSLVFNTKEPSWLTQQSSFNSTPIKYVFKELEDQYNIKIQTKGIKLETLYTGTFPNNNLKVALSTVFTTLDLAFTMSKDGKTVIIKE